MVSTARTVALCLSEGQARTLHIRSRHRKGEGPNNDRQDNANNLAGISMALVDERGAKAEC
jgi:hypothetical protein